jgi:hypothetical protein
MFLLAILWHPNKPYSKISIALMKWIQIITISSFDREMAAAGSCRKRPLMGQFHFARRRQLFPKQSSQGLA